MDVILSRVADCSLALNRIAIARVVLWLNDPDVNQYLEARTQTWTEAAWQGWYKTQVQRGRFVYWIVSDSKAVGTLTLGPIDQRNMSAPIGLMVGDKEVWGHSIGSVAIARATRLPITKPLHRFWAGVLAENKRSIRAFEKAGFVIEGVLRQARRYGDGWMDEVVMGLVRE